MFKNYLKHVSAFLLDVNKPVMNHFAPYNVNNLSTISENIWCKEQQVSVNNVVINYLEVGEKGTPILLLPGALGTIQSDFKPQVEYFKKNNLKIVAWDPPGYGKSIPPKRQFSNDFLKRDAVVACALMKTLGHPKFSVIGWSDGGITALIMAAKFPKNLNKTVVLGANAYILPQEMEIYNKIRNINSWSERMRAPMIATYGQEYFQELWTKWVDTMQSIYQTNAGNICKDCLSEIKCSTLIVHGERDKMVMREHPDFLKANIKNSRLEIFENGGHNLHLKYHDEFNKMVHEFLNQKNDYAI